MSKKKPASGTRAKKKTDVSLVRSSAAEYLTFVAASGQGGVEAVYADENVWLSQKMMGLLYAVETHTINYHLKKIFADKELQEVSVIRNFRITAADGKNYDTGHYNLSAVIAVGYKVNSERAVQFRKWATGIIESFTIKGFAMDDERLKNDGSILGKKYFEEQLQRIREIRLSERKFYQKITDLYATAIDYDVTAAASQRFFATVQNKLHWAIHGQTAAELILNRADAAKDHMGLTSWKDAQGFRVRESASVFRKLRVLDIPVHVYHYGWVRNPSAFLRKQAAFGRLYHDDAWLEEHLPISEEFPTCYELGDFTGTHPEIMRERIKEDGLWTKHFDPKRSLPRPFAVAVCDAFERLTGKRVFEYRNYELLR